LQISCPVLVEIVENGTINDFEAIELMKKYINPLIEFQAEKIILGCTHYPYLKPMIEDIIGNGSTTLIDPAEFMVNEVKDYLEINNMINDSEELKVDFYVSSNPDKFVIAGQRFYSKCEKAQETDLRA